MVAVALVVGPVAVGVAVVLAVAVVAVDGSALSCKTETDN